MRNAIDNIRNNAVNSFQVISGKFPVYMHIVINNNSKD